jgi:hypothetical protein
MLVGKKIAQAFLQLLKFNNDRFVNSHSENLFFLITINLSTLKI